jgi:hypothetical protein
MQIKYSINHGQDLDFYVPGQNQNMRWASHSVSGCLERGGDIANHFKSAMDSVQA